MADPWNPIIVSDDLSPTLENYPTPTSITSYNAGLNKGKTHPCTWSGCDRVFTCPHNVRQHIRETHTHERPHSCEICAAKGEIRSFARPYSLTRHKMNVHKTDLGSDRGKKATQQQVSSGLKNISIFNNTPSLISNFPDDSLRLPKPTHNETSPDFLGLDHTTQGFALPDAIFAYQPTSCIVCVSILGNFDALYTHLHLVHGTESYPQCLCAVCQMMFV